MSSSFPVEVGMGTVTYANGTGHPTSVPDGCLLRGSSTGLSFKKLRSHGRKLVLDTPATVPNPAFFMKSSSLFCFQNGSTGVVNTYFENFIDNVLFTIWQNCVSCDNYNIYYIIFDLIQSFHQKNIWSDLKKIFMIWILWFKRYWYFIKLK